jgi:hypothetical protein
MVAVPLVDRCTRHMHTAGAGDIRGAWWVVQFYSLSLATTDITRDASPADEANKSSLLLSRHCHRHYLPLLPPFIRAVVTKLYRFSHIVPPAILTSCYCHMLAVAQNRHPSPITPVPLSMSNQLCHRCIPRCSSHNNTPLGYHLPVTPPFYHSSPTYANRPPSPAYVITPSQDPL